MGRTAQPENVDVYELGVKANFPGGYANVAVFKQSIKGFQSNAFTGLGYSLVNAGEESVKGFELDSALEPQVTTVKRGEDTVEEYRLGGRLYMMKVTPAGGGTPYYLVDHTGNGSFARQNAHDTGLRPPMWVIHSF